MPSVMERLLKVANHLKARDLTIPVDLIAKLQSLGADVTKFV